MIQYPDAVFAQQLSLCSQFLQLFGTSRCRSGHFVTGFCDISSLNALQWNPVFWDLAPPLLRCHFTVLSCILYQKVKNEL